MFAVMRIAWELSLTEREVLEMTVEEFSRWGAFLEIMNPPNRRQ